MSLTLLRILAGVLLTAACVAGVWWMRERIRGLEHSLEVVTADLKTARDQVTLEQGATRAEAQIATREKVIIREVDRGRVELAAAASGGRVVLLDAWARNARRLRDEPESADAASAGASPDGA